MDKTMTDLSILDLSPLRQGETFKQAVDNTVGLAELAERLDLSRFWIAEHHNVPHLASSATSLLIQRVLDKTSFIRVGSGGVMLPNHSPYIVAEQYGTLANLYPNRVDLGLGRAPGTDQATARAIRRHQDDFAMNFPADIRQLQFYFGRQTDNDKVRAYPAMNSHVPIYILGSSVDSAYLAAEMGLPYVFGSHFAPRFLHQAVKIYRDNFKPSSVQDKPKLIVGINAIVANSDEEAHFLATTHQQFFMNVFTGELSGIKPPVENIADVVPPHILAMVNSMMGCSVIGSPKTVKTQIKQLQTEVQADELMAVSYIYDLEKQHKSYEMLAECSRA